MEPEARTDTVVLIHGLWMTPLSWEHWVARYEQRGLRVMTPGYPGIAPGGGLWRGRRVHRRRRGEGDQGAALQRDQGNVPGAAQPRQRAPRRAHRREGLPLRVHQQ